MTVSSGRSPADAPRGAASGTSSGTTGAPDDDPDPRAPAATDAELEAVVRVASAVTGMPMATVNLLDDVAQVQLATLGFPQLVTPRDESLCDRALRTGSVFASADLRADPRFAGSPWVDGRRDRVRGYAMVPLPLDGEVVGTLCVQSREVHPLDQDQLDRLVDLGAVVSALLQRHRDSRQTAELARASEAARAELAAAHAELTAARAFDTALLDSLPVAVAAVDADGRMTAFNRVSRLWHGTDGDPSLTPERLAQRYDLRSAEGEPLQPDEVPLLRLLREGRLEDVRITIAPAGRPPRLVSCNGDAVRDPAGRLLGAVVTMADITAQLELESRLRAAAMHDPLTGLPNRSLLVDRLQLALATATRGGGGLAVLYCDLDGFKGINDRWGHTAGDAVLVGAAGRLSAAVRPGDTVARIGGDEFVLVCPDVDGPAVAEQLAARVTAALAEPLRSGTGTTHAVGISVGYALAAPGATPETLLTAADEAMYRVKQGRRAAARPL
ncbi:diguanylate cyclase domain-containing protein [Modestobacter versicolor]|uniref:diguanylate cyclase domain-containing protein n=1 Tax=Modestobacter versicolor TaxID=429133 RepID=UPI0034DDF027